MSNVYDRLTEYLLHGGLYSPDLMQHDKVRELLMECREEIDELKDAIRRLAAQDATLSVQGGNVTVTMDATLTDEEREAVRFASVVYQQGGREKDAATLRSLLERLA